jgi:hypothetical protein
MYNKNLTITTTPTIFISSLQWVKADDKHHPGNRVSATILKARGEDSAILLASNRPHNKDQTKKDRKGERQKGKKKGKTKNKNRYTKQYMVHVTT